jgi:tripartite-type tricarboxylate transporter receptor subunit TctC
VNPTLYAKLSYDPVISFEPVSLIAKVHNVLVVNPSVPVRSAGELIDYVRRNPGKLNYATGGNGSAAHMAIIAFSLAAGLDMVHVPYRGTGPAVQDLISGQVQLTMTGAPTVLEHAHAGLLRALAVSSAAPIPAAPDLPTISEVALPGFEASQWYGVLAPAGTPRAVVGRLNAEIRTAMTSPEVTQRLLAEGAEPWVSTPEAFHAHIVREIAVWGDIIRRAKVPSAGKSD